MNKKEKLFFLDKCKHHYLNAVKIRLINPYMYLEELEKARILKEFIENYIDCQPTKYYNIYQEIVKLENKF